MTSKKSSVLGIVFLTVFLDIVGFSIIFPLFPGMLDHYVGLEGVDSPVGQLAQWLAGFAGEDTNAVTTLFGGLLGSLYGLLQFVFSTVWGGISDRFGRRPTLLLTLVGTVASALLWVWAGSFAILIAARVLGGIMAGNISTASAAVADCTEAEDRAKGMGIVGMAIGLGFILGPAIGGFSMNLSLLGSAPSEPMQAFALNPFSAPALISAVLALLNLIWVWKRFPETFPIEVRATCPKLRSFNPVVRLRSLSFPGIRRTNFLYLSFLTAFAAVEFTLTFLAVERLQYSEIELAWLFVFIGLIIALVQGGFVRRLAPKYGERRVAFVGLALTAPGFLLLASAQATFQLYLALGFMAVGSALVMPCLSALISRYTPANRQGLALGTFRSMGSLSRALGPVLGALLYWKFGSAAPCEWGAYLLIIPLGLAWTLPPPTIPKTEYAIRSEASSSTSDG
ncbi:MAG: MFS transporter [Planctomycetota bacterium]|jgi:MFS family permease|nr:MFS transporter [Planctomycetota bacterium]MDP6940630.1 MFS transporter [Planctomycetota bacterium]